MSASCISCPSYCLYGCYNGKCNLCNNDVCYSCTNYQNCLQCKPNSSNITSVCACDQKFFFNNTSELCQACKDPCLECNEAGCINCIDSYYLNSQTCYPCPYRCQSCINSTCDICNDVSYLINGLCYCNYTYTGQFCNVSCPDKCLVCDNGCTTCINNAELINSACQCIQRYTGSDCATKCPPGCLYCNNGCTQCVSNSILINNTCICNLGFYGENCTEEFLNLTLSTSDKNIILAFSDILLDDLLSEKLAVTIFDLSYKWSLTKINHYEYCITLIITDPYPLTTAIIELSNNIISIHNALLYETTYLIPLNESSDYQDSLIKSIYKEFYSVAATYVMYGLISLSVIASNPAALWSFINMVQLLCFFHLSSINLPTDIQGILIGLRSYYIFPNAAEYFFNGGRIHSYTHAIELGFTTNSLLLNTGKQATGFLFFNLYFCFFFLLSKIDWKLDFINDLIKSIIIGYKYGFFLRFAIQNYLEFCVSFLLGIIFFDFLTFESMGNFIASIIFAVIIYSGSFKYNSNLLLAYS